MKNWRISYTKLPQIEDARGVLAYSWLLVIVPGAINANGENRTFLDETWWVENANDSTMV